MRLGPSGRRCDRGRTSSSWTREAALGGPGLPPEGGPVTRSCPGIRAAGAGRRCRGPAQRRLRLCPGRRSTTRDDRSGRVRDPVADRRRDRPTIAQRSDLAGHGTGRALLPSHRRHRRLQDVLWATQDERGPQRCKASRARATVDRYLREKGGTAICGKALPHGERYLRKTAAGEERPSILTGRPFVQPFRFEVSDRIRRRRSPSWFLAPPDRSVRRSLRGVGSSTFVAVVLAVKRELLLGVHRHRQERR